MEDLDIEKQSILLLTSYFKKPENEDVTPLTPTEWKLFAGWLKDRRYSPGSLLSEDGPNIIESWDDNKITRERLITLLRRGAQMSLALEKWLRAGVWILTRSDPEYPQKLKTRLGAISPPVLFGVGNRELLNKTGIAVIGSRDITLEDISFSQQLGKVISEKDHTVISGGAKGVDEAAMLGALSVLGSAVGVLADNLLQKSLTQLYREYLIKGKLVLISSYYPEAGFSVGNAMGRNKYIYCLSEKAVVVHSGLKGGTWTGALENLKKKWVPLYVKTNNDKNAGNALLIKEGGVAIKVDVDIDTFINSIIAKKEFVPDDYKITAVHEPRSDSISKQESKTELTPEEIDKKLTTINFYDLFLFKLKNIMKDKELKLKDIKKDIDINTSQLNEWLKKAEEDGVILKFSKPIKFKLVTEGSQQPDLFNQTSVN